MLGQKKCPICGHYASESSLNCPCRCHDPFRIKSFTTNKKQKVYKE